METVFFNQKEGHLDFPPFNMLTNFITSLYGACGILILVLNLTQGACGRLSVMSDTTMIIAIRP